MMTIKKIFLSVFSEKAWLEQMAKDGYVLKKHCGISYMFEKTEKNVFYRYIFLKNGRKTFLELDYKNRDPKCNFIYGNGMYALFSREDTFPEIMPNDELKLNYVRYRQRRQTSALCYIAAACAFAMAARTFSPLCVLSVATAMLGIMFMIDVKKTDKVIKEEL